MFGMDVLAYPQIVRIVFRFPDFSCIREWWGNVRSANWQKLEFPNFQGHILTTL